MLAPKCPSLLRGVGVGAERPTGVENTLQSPCAGAGDSVSCRQTRRLLNIFKEQCFWKAALRKLKSAYQKEKKKHKTRWHGSLPQRIYLFLNCADISFHPRKRNRFLHPSSNKPHDLKSAHKVWVTGQGTGQKLLQ